MMTTAEKSNTTRTRAYLKPQLTRFGSVRELTQAGSGQSNEAANKPECRDETNKVYNTNCFD